MRSSIAAQWVEPLRKLHNIQARHYLWRRVAPTCELSSNTRNQRSAHSLGSMAWKRMDFEDAKRLFAAATTAELARSFMIFKVCAVRPIVANASRMYKMTTMTLGHRLPDTFIRASFFKHFCGGENESDLMPVMEKLGAHGVGAILDYAAEADVDCAPRRDHATHPDYLGEAVCDANAEIVIASIDAASAAAERGGQEPFAACKFTGIGQPELLERVSAILTSLKISFAQMDTDCNGRLTVREFVDGLLRAGSPLDAQQIALLFEDLDLDRNGMVDYADWVEGLCPAETIFTESFRPLEEPAYTHLTNGAFAPLNKQERSQYARMIARANRLAEHASQKGVKLLVDAEQTYMQPAIDHLALLMMQRHNKEKPIIFNTYQCYLRDAAERVQRDMERAERQGFVFAAKAVRGAYMVQESRLANQRGCPSPIHGSKEATHACYDTVVDTILSSKAAVNADARARQSAVMIASHNEDSVIKAVNRMRELGLEPRDGIYFAQLQGMCDHVSFALAQEGFCVYKYLPYGPVKEVMPYLLRRLEENSDIMGAVGKQRLLIWTELKRRFWAISSPDGDTCDSTCKL